MANALVVHPNSLPQSQKAERAAQYVRMSTDLQKYSIQNQAAAIAAFAQLNSLTIVRTYRDEGESGLSIKNRIGLTQLIKDVQSGSADFGYVLVYDISRWGRFQDVDESAYYEFVCKQAGIKVAYCAEQFDNDGSLISHIMKNIKRVMAAEFSRELSAKVHAGQSRLASMGFKMGGPVCYGMQRLLVDENSQPKAILKPGEWKSLISEHVKVQPASDDQVAIVRWIFEEFTRVRSEEKIARKLNQQNVPTETGLLWSRGKVARILQNETYIGNLLYNRESKKLGMRLVHNPPTLWIRSEGCVEPIIDRDLFMRVREMRKGRHFELSEEEMLVRLRKLWMKKGELTARMINQSAGLPCADSYYRHFGSLFNALRLIGYTGTRYWDSVHIYKLLLATIARDAALLRERFEKRGVKAGFDAPTACIRIHGALNVSFTVARWQQPTRKHEPSGWLLHLKMGAPAGWIVAPRLREGNRIIQDYLLVPSRSVNGTWLRFMEKTRERRKIERFANFEELAQSLVRRLTRTIRRASPSGSSNAAESSQAGRLQSVRRKGTKHKSG